MQKIISKNRKAFFNYIIEDKFEAGIILSGSEVKSLRLGKVSIEDGYAEQMNNEIYLLNCYIAEYKEAGRFNHSIRRARKLLLHKREIRKIIGTIKQKGYTIVPLCLYFNDKNIAKIELAIAIGKQLHDKRQTIKEREWNRNQHRAMRDNIIQRSSK